VISRLNQSPCVGFASTSPPLSIMASWESSSSCQRPAINSVVQYQLFHGQSNTSSSSQNKSCNLTSHRDLDVEFVLWMMLVKCCSSKCKSKRPVVLSIEQRSSHVS
jgi:hypothetical protein